MKEIEKDGVNAEELEGVNAAEIDSQNENDGAQKAQDKESNSNNPEFDEIADIDKQLANVLKSEEEGAKPEESPKDKEEKPAADESASKKSKYIKVDDAYLSTLPEEEQKYYVALKGESLSEKALKIHYNAQKTILDGKKEPTPKVEMSTPQTPVTFAPDQVATAKANLIFDELRRIYPDIPEEARTNPEVLKDFEDSLRQSDFYEYRAKREKIANDTEKYVNDYVDLQTNANDYRLKSLNDAHERFTKYLDDKKIKPADININLDEAYYHSILFPDGKPNPEIITQKHGVYLIDETALFRALLDNNLENIANYSYNRDLTSKKEPPKKAPNQLGGDINGSKAVRTDGVPKIDERTASVEDIDAALDAIKKKMKEEK